MAKRRQDTHLGGLWEFPGGKLAAGENPRQALQRELFEELGIRVLELRPWKQLRHDYGDRVVMLHVWHVLSFTGEPQGLEGQPLQWLEPRALSGLPLPAPNHALVEALIGEFGGDQLEASP